MKIINTPFFKYFILAFTIWSLLLISLLNYDLYKHKNGLKQVALAVADAYYNKDIAFREWAASHGGVYVEIDSTTQPNKYLTNVSERDIVSPKGKKLTLLNPAYMLRQFNEFTNNSDGSIGHITRINPIRKENAPDPWETAALNLFAQGDSVFYEFSENDSLHFLRYMKPVYITENCLKCHADLGYKIGDIGGGISIYLPLKNYSNANVYKFQFTSYSIIWLLGITGLLLAFISFFNKYKTEKATNLKVLQMAERFKQLSNLSFEGILLHKNGIVIDANAALCKLLECNLDDLMGKNFIDLFVVDPFRKTFLSKINFEHAYPFEIEIQLQNGVSLPVEIESIKTKSNNIDISTTSIRNILPRKQAQTAIDKIQNKLNQHFELTPLAVIEWDMDLRIVRWNASATRIFGYEADEVLGRRPDFLMPGTKKEQVANIWAHLKGMKNSEQTTNTHITKDGQIITCNWHNTSLLNEYGNLIGIASMAQDITEHKKAEETIANERRLLRTLIDNLPDAIYVKDKEARKLISNKADWANMKCKNEEEIIGKNDFELFPENIAAEFYKVDTAVINTNQAIIDKEEYFFNAAGEKRWLLTSKYPLSDEKGEVIGLVGVGRDITQQKKIKKALSQAQHNLKTHIENTPLAVLELDANFRIVQWNKAAEQLFGYKYKEVLGENGKLIFSNNMFNEFVQIWSELKTKKNGKSITLDNIKQNGEQIICKWHNTPLFDSDGNLTGIAAVIQDITELKNIELERERYIKLLTKPIEDNSELQFTDLFDINEIQQLQDQFASATGVATIITDINGKPITKNSNFCELCSMIRNTDQGLKNCMQSDAVIGGNAEGGIVIQKCLSGGLWDAGTSIKVGGKHIANWLIGQVRDESTNDSEILKYVNSIGGDVPKAKDALKRVSSLSFDQFNEIAKMLHVFGEMLSSIAYQNIQQARSINRLKDTEQKVILKNNELISAEEEIRGANEELMATNQALHNNMIDLENALLKAEESERLKSSFLANMSHEIRTPLNGIIGFSQLLVDANLTPEKHKTFTDIIINSSNQLLSIVNDILDISKIETGQLQLRLETINIQTVFNDLEVFFKPKTEQSGIALYFENNLNEPFDSIIADKGRLVQIFNNLISNAIKFTIKGHVKIQSSLIDDYILFSINDTGTGISDEFKTKIFERFQQGENFLRDVPKGTGLGLTICKSLIELMKGEIWVESIMDFGSTFYFKIPFKQPEKPEEFIIVEEINEQPKFSGYNILVAEDVDYNYMLLIEYLEDTEASFIRAKNGIEAVEICATNYNIDLVLMDIRMPQMDGYEATRKIKAKRPTLPIIAQTAFAFDEKHEALNAGCDNIISKPINKEILFDLINKHCPKPNR